MHQGFALIDSLCHVSDSVVEWRLAVMIDEYFAFVGAVSVRRRRCGVSRKGFAKMPEQSCEFAMRAV